MILKNNFLGLLCCAFLLPTYSVFAQTDSLNLSALTFEQAARYMSLNNYTVNQSDNLIHQKEQELKAARGLYFPKISLSANYVLMADDINLDLNPVKETITPLYETLGNYGVFSDVPNPDPNTNTIMPILPDNVGTQGVRAQMLEGLELINASDWNTIIQKKQFGMVNAQFVMPLYTGGKINAANKAAKIELNEAQTEKSLKQDELFCELVDRYYGLVLSNHALQVREEVLGTMKSHLEDAQKLKDNGMIAEAEYLHAKVYYSQAERDYKKTVRENTVVNSALLNTLSTDTLYNIAPVSQLFYVDSLNDLNYYISSCKQNSKMLKMIEHKKELAHQGYKVEMGNYLPTIAAVGTYDIANKDLSEYIPDYVVGVGLTWSIFDGTSRSRKIKAAKYREAQVEDFSAQSELNINMAIHKYHQEVNIQLEQLHDLESAQQFASEYYRVRKKAFHEGMATTTEVSDASLALAKVKIDQLQAIYNYDIALAKLLFYSGTLDTFSSYQNNTKVEYSTY